MTTKIWNYFLSNDRLDLNKCKSGYFSYNKWQCFNYIYRKVKGNKNKCSYCNNIKEGGKEGFFVCERKDDKIYFINK